MTPHDETRAREAVAQLFWEYAGGRVFEDAEFWELKQAQTGSLMAFDYERTYQFADRFIADNAALFAPDGPLAPYLRPTEPAPDGAARIAELEAKVERLEAAMRALDSALLVDDPWGPDDKLTQARNSEAIISAWCTARALIAQEDSRHD